MHQAAPGEKVNINSTVVCSIPLSVLSVVSILCLLHKQETTKYPARGNSVVVSNDLQYIYFDKEWESGSCVKHHYIYVSTYI